jgi:nitrate/nitrite transporter NarK
MAGGNAGARIDRAFAAWSASTGATHFKPAWENRMKSVALFVAIAAVFAFVSYGASAMPMSSLKEVKSADQNLQTVSGGCGRWRHRGPHGHCRPN